MFTWLKSTTVSAVILPHTRRHTPSYKLWRAHLLIHSHFEVTSLRHSPGPQSRMFSEHECGICYRTYNAGRRCPRELHCKHSFCESCLLLLALSRPQGPDGADRLIVCPLCRHSTAISGEGRVRAELRVDECVLERLLVSGVLDKEEEEEEEEDPVGHVQDGCDDTAEPTLPETPAEESDFSTGPRGGRLRRSCRKAWRMVRGKGSRRRGGENCMTNEDLRNIAMMGCYMF